MEKKGKGAEKQDSESTVSFQNYGLRRLFMILFHGWYLNKGQETLFFNLMYDKFWFDADFCASRFHR